MYQTTNSASILFSGFSFLKTDKEKNAAAYYRGWLAASKLVKLYTVKAAKCAANGDTVGATLNEAVAAEFDYESHLLALKLANNKSDSRHTLFAAMNKSRAKMKALQSRVLALRDAGLVVA